MLVSAFLFCVLSLCVLSLCVYYSLCVLSFSILYSSKSISWSTHSLVLSPKSPVRIADNLKTDLQPIVYAQAIPIYVVIDYSIHNAPRLTHALVYVTIVPCLRRTSPITRPLHHHTRQIPFPLTRAHVAKVPALRRGRCELIARQVHQVRDANG